MGAANPPLNISHVVVNAISCNTLISELPARFLYHCVQRANKSKKMPHFCAVVKCSTLAGRYDRHYYMLPKVITHQGVQTEELSKKRRLKWFAHMGRADLSFSTNNIRELAPDAYTLFTLFECHPAHHSRLPSYSHRPRPGLSGAHTDTQALWSPSRMLVSLCSCASSVNSPTDSPRRHIWGP